MAVLDIDNGARLETYAIRGDVGQVCLNGAAARPVHPGDTVIVLTYADYDGCRPRPGRIEPARRGHLGSTRALR